MSWVEVWAVRGRCGARAGSGTRGREGRWWCWRRWGHGGGVSWGEGGRAREEGGDGGAEMRWRSRRGYRVMLRLACCQKKWYERCTTAASPSQNAYSQWDCITSNASILAVWRVNWMHLEGITRILSSPYDWGSRPQSPSSLVALATLVVLLQTMPSSSLVRCLSATVWEGSRWIRLGRMNMTFVLGCEKVDGEMTNVVTDGILGRVWHSFVRDP